jgi:hypothetical protein
MFRVRHFELVDPKIPDEDFRDWLFIIVGLCVVRPHNELTGQDEHHLNVVARGHDSGGPISTSSRLLRVTDENSQS